MVIMVAPVLTGWRLGTDRDGSGGASTKLISGRSAEGCPVDSTVIINDLCVRGGQSKGLISGHTASGDVDNRNDDVDDATLVDENARLF